jgi:hypothetical protein
MYEFGFQKLLFFLSKKGGEAMISRRYMIRPVAHCSEGCML